jgi:hypothetical protein
MDKEQPGRRSLLLVKADESLLAVRLRQSTMDYPTSMQLGRFGNPLNLY